MKAPRAKDQEAQAVPDDQHQSLELSGPERDEDRALRTWFDAQEPRNLDRLEAGATMIIQLVTGLYGVLFAVLALSDQPDYLQNQLIQMTGTVSLVAFFLALVSAVLVVLPRPYRYQRDNLTAMQRAYQRMQTYKAGLLGTAMGLFLLGAACLGAVIVSILWRL